MTTKKPHRGHSHRPAARHAAPSPRRKPSPPPSPEALRARLDAAFAGTFANPIMAALHREAAARLARISALASHTAAVRGDVTHG
ncbi:MAG: hypothetical protein V1809_01670 [Planctomycetota bacterium]